MKHLQQSFYKFGNWFLTGKVEEKVLTEKEEEVENLRKQMREQLQLLESRGLPIRIVTL